MGTANENCALCAGTGSVHPYPHNPMVAIPCGCRARKTASLSDPLTQARAEGRREGIEEAAKWHDEQYSRLQAENSEMVRKFGLPDHERLNDAYNHKAHAAGIRALTTAAGKEG